MTNRIFADNALEIERLQRELECARASEKRLSDHLISLRTERNEALAAKREAGVLLEQLCDGPDPLKPGFWGGFAASAQGKRRLAERQRDKLAEAIREIDDHLEGLDYLSDSTLRNVIRNALATLENTDHG